VPSKEDRGTAKSVKAPKKRSHRFWVNSVLNKIRSSTQNQKRLKIIKAVAKGNAPWIDEVLIEALDDPSEEIRDFLIQELGQKKRVNLVLLSLKLKRPPWYVKSSVMKILALQKRQEAFSLIEEAVDDSNAEVRRCAAQALGEIGGKQALALLAKLMKDGNHFVRKSAEEAMRKIAEIKFA